jgi:integrase
MRVPSNFGLRDGADAPGGPPRQSPAAGVRARRRRRRLDDHDRWASGGGSSSSTTSWRCTSGLRPEEAAGLGRGDVVLPDDPDQDWIEPNDRWGELHLRAARPDAGKQWTDEGAERDSRGLKHRAEGQSRRVPCPPPLTRLLREHLALLHGEPADFLFRGVQGHPLATITYRRAWDKARRSVLTAHEYRSPLARCPYDLRHACLSTWLNGGVPANQVAEWAGPSVEMLLRVYAKCLDGQDEIARRRITAALDDSQ